MAMHSAIEKIALYKDLWRLHRLMPPALRFMGNQYIRSEWDRHKAADQAAVERFMKEWKNYHAIISEQLRRDAERENVKFGKPLDPTILDAMSDDQIGQLHALRVEAKGEGKANRS
ncbi:hypothetical protein DFJ73DRAFT_782330 [Zopfochytrium polystomum]|nr:hypothetical protein DFJ73DRAFT_782330 [Zopfochytrium polystomum]